MLPQEFKLRLFDRMSIKTMRYVRSLPKAQTDELGAEVLRQLEEDFFVNGSITSHSAVPELMAGVWLGGRESVLVSDQLDRMTKEAMSATISRANDCPYCGDMLISLTHGRDQHAVARAVYRGEEARLAPSLLRTRLLWAESAAHGRASPGQPTPFTDAELPEAIATVFSFAYINRMSHVLMDGSPVDRPLGSKALKSGALRLFGSELSDVSTRVLQAGRALSLLPPAEPPSDVRWALPNPRIADALSRWIAAVERRAAAHISPRVRERIRQTVATWRGEQAPISRSWVEAHLKGLDGNDRNVARLLVLLAIASYQISEDVVLPILGQERDQARLVSVLAWGAITVARHIAAQLASSAQCWQTKAA